MLLKGVIFQFGSQISKIVTGQKFLTAEDLRNPIRRLIGGEAKCLTILLFIFNLYDINYISRI